MKLICPSCKEKSENVAYKIANGKIELQCPVCHKDFKRPLPSKMTIQEVTPKPEPVKPLIRAENDEEKRPKISVGEDRGLSQAIRSWVRSGPINPSEFLGK